MLANNGGRVQTVAIAGGSVAVNAGNSGLLPPDTEDLNGNTNAGEPLPVDARGQMRVFGGELDIGAFELLSSPPTEVVNTSVAVDEGGSADITGRTLYSPTPNSPTLSTRSRRRSTSGTLFRSGVAIGLGSTFTQSDIDNLRISYTHDGSETAAAFGFEVSDGLGGILGGQHPPSPSIR